MQRRISFQSPSHRGGGAAGHAGHYNHYRANVSIPFSSVFRLPGSRVSIPFSSGRRRHLTPGMSDTLVFQLFQSPSHRGGGATANAQTQQPAANPGFNPLLIGEAAPPRKKPPFASAFAQPVSIPFSSGRRRHRRIMLQYPPAGTVFQSPSHRGGGATSSTSGSSLARSMCFNPLLIGEAAPPVYLEYGDREDLLFQSPSHRGGGATTATGKMFSACYQVSIPFSSGRRRHRWLPSPRWTW